MFQRYMARLDNPRPKPPPFTPKEFDSNDAEKWRLWRINFELHCGQSEVTNAQARRGLAMAMVGIAKKVTANIPLGLNGEDTGPVGQLLDLYEIAFTPPADADKARAEFLSSCQKPGETDEEWHARVQYLHQRAYPNVARGDRNQNMDLVDRFVFGLRSQAQRDMIGTNRPHNMVDALARARAATASLLMKQKADREWKDRRAGGQGGDDTDYKISALDDDEISAIDGSCYVCRSKDHQIRDCRAWKQSLRYQARKKALQNARRGGKGGGAGKPRPSRGGGGAYGRGSARKTGRGGNSNRGREGKGNGGNSKKAVFGLGGDEDIDEEDEEAGDAEESAGADAPATGDEEQAGGSIGSLIGAADDLEVGAADDLEEEEEDDWPENY